MSKDKESDIKRKYTPHDGLYKYIFGELDDAQELFKECLPPEIQDIINLSTLKIEKEGFVEETLQRNTNDILYSAKMKNNKDFHLYLICEHQSDSDRYIAFRLAKFMLLIWQKYKDRKEDFPVILPIVLFNGKNPYNAPRNLWSLSNSPEIAKKYTFGDYILIDLQSIKNSDINYDNPISIVLYFMKNIHDKDILAVLREFLENYGKKPIAQDKKNGYKYFKSVLYYIENKLSQVKKLILKDTLVELLPENDGEKIMVTIADSYRNEEKIRMATLMLKKNKPISEIIEFTGLSKTQVLKIQDTLTKSSRKKAS